MTNSIYDFFAEDYHLKRKNPWKALENFLFEINIDFPGIIIDLGCGNGRNFKLFKNSKNKLIGIDNSIEFLKIAQNNLKSDVIDDINCIGLILGEISNLPIRPNSINNIFSIAAIHHVRDKSQREEAVSNFDTILNDCGYILLTVWRRWQKKYKDFFFHDKLKRTFNF